MLNEIAEYFGGQAALARRLKIDKAAVSNWHTHGIPSRRAVQIEVLSKGKFKAVDIMRNKL